MNSAEILYPVVTLVAWTFLVLLQIPIRRFNAAFKKDAKAENVNRSELAKEPVAVHLANRNYTNMLELPILFYLVCVIYFVTLQVDQLVVYLSWAYVVMRVFHSIIHMSYNNVVHRFSVFMMSNIVLGMLWMILFMRLSTEGAF